MTCRWPAREAMEEVWRPEASHGATEDRACSHPSFKTKSGQQDARGCGEKENPRVTKEATSCKARGYEISSKPKTTKGRIWELEEVVEYQPLDRGHHSGTPVDGRRKDRGVICQS